MEKTSTNTRNTENRPPVRLLNLATIASQIMEDVGQIYGQDVQRQTRKTKRAEIHVSEQNRKADDSWIGRLVSTIRTFSILRGLNSARGSVTQNPSSALSIPKIGDLIVIATRSKDMHAKIQLRLALQIAITNKQPIVIFSARDSFIQFTRKLVGLMADIQTDADIYDGKLNEIELSRLRSALAELMVAKVFMYPVQRYGLDEICNAPRMLSRQSGAAGLVLVDAVQYLMDDQRRSIDIQSSLIELKVLADELKAPVIALYQLDSTIEGHPLTLTRHELCEIERLNKLTDGLVLMSWAQERFVFSLPKIPNAKPVEWLDMAGDRQ